MEALLPSEIARLVLGYLEDQKCIESAKQFLETSPHLQECRTVLSFGKRFSTKVNGLTLMDIVEKFSAIGTMIQERLNKVTDCEQLKHCGDLIEQLKFLVEEPRGQRFVVNINVPSQNNTQVSNGSPIIASSMRKRRHSNSERIKRTSKSQSTIVQQPDVTSPPICHNVDTTPLESLPGNSDLLRQLESSASVMEKKDDNVTQESHNQYNLDKNEDWNAQQCEMDVNSKRKEESDIPAIMSLKRCTTATNTDELLSFTSAEVQTIPYEIPESESESNDEPIENLSILTKEILNRTELQECIAENINKAIIPTDLSLRDESLNDSVGGEGNTSIMAELNNAIKSIVEATETDPVFEKFLYEIIGPYTETDTSPEEDGEGKQSPKSVNEAQEKQAEVAFSNISSPEPTIVDTRVPTENNTADVPLKHRLRSSSRQQNNRIEDEVDKVRDQEKEQSALEDQNAAAVLSIINANIINGTSNDKKTLNDVKETTIVNDTGQKVQTVIPAVINKDDVAVKPLTSLNVQKVGCVALSAGSNGELNKVKKATVKRPRPTKLKRDQAISDNQLITEQEIMTMPTLVVCSKEEINDILTMNNSSNIRSTSTSRFIPIAPKDPSRIGESMETVYLRTVNVAQKLPTVVRTLPAVEEKLYDSTSSTLLQSQKKNTKVNKKVKTVHKPNATEPAVVNHKMLDPVVPAQSDKIVGGESITLYGNESSAKTSLDSAIMPTINLDENISLSGGGLSPYLKFNCSKINQNHNLSDIDLSSMMENVKSTTTTNVAIEEQRPTISKNTECDIISKRTPKSLLKSRSKNSRLSLSTPRKRSSHIRALDFNTPPKVISPNRKANGNGTTQFSSTSAKRLKSVCRTTLFKSPPFSSSTSMTTQKQKSPMKVCQSYKIPIATRSPAPKLMGGWDKYNGVGVIIGDVSSHGSTSASSSSEDRTQHKTSKAPAESWDADLRKGIQLNKKDETEIKKPIKRKYSVKDENSIICKKNKYNSRSSKNKDKGKTSEKNREFNQEIEDINEPEEQKNVKVVPMEEHLDAAVLASDPIINKLDKISEPTVAPETLVKTDNTKVSSDATVEKKPVKKYVQLKTIRTNLRKPENESKKNAEDAQVKSSQTSSEFSKVFFVDSTQHILRLPDMIDVETPRKSNDISGPPPTPRMLSPSAAINAITPFNKFSEDSIKLRSFIRTPEFPITPCITITPKHTEETTRDIVKKVDYNSPYYKPTSEISQQETDRTYKSKSSPDNQELSAASSSHIKLQTTHNSLTSGYQTCTSSKLEITQFEVIKENLPKEEAIKELKIASSSKESVAELNAPVVDSHVNLIEMDELKDINKRNETVIDGNSIAASDSSSSSDITSSSDSSSSSSTSSSNTNSSTTCSSTEKHDDSAANRQSVNVATLSVNAPVLQAQKEVPVNTLTDVCKNLNAPTVGPDSSPKKVFAIAKSDDQIQSTLKNTPAKDEALLNEANISETPSGSKSGMENFTNLSTKITALLTENKEWSRPEKKIDNFEVNVLRPKLRIKEIQCIQPESSKAVESAKSTRGRCESSLNEQESSTFSKLVEQLEEKRLRMIAKFRDAPKSNLSGGAAHKRILGKVSDSRKRNARFSRPQQNVRSTAKYSYRGRNKNAVSRSNVRENSVNTRERCELQSRAFANQHVDHDKETKKQVPASRGADPDTTSHKNNADKPLTDQAVENHIEESESVQTHKNSSADQSKEQSTEKSPVKENTERGCGIDVIKEEIREIFTDNNVDSKVSEREMNPAENVIVQETLTSDKTIQEMRDQAEDKADKLKQFANYADKSKCTLKCKVDQVKRDLFSDEENDQKAVKTKNERNAKKTANVEKYSVDVVEVSHTAETADIGNPKEELSSVLQCLQLVPAHKNEGAFDESQTIKEHRENSKCNTGNEVDNETNEVDIHNYKAEYHFVYDDSVPMRKRRRRYSGHELQIEINYADLSDPNPVECIKVMKATEFEEIFNLPPKSKKRTLTKKTPCKNEKNCETPQLRMDGETFNLKEGKVKPLASSSPLDETSIAKMKKIVIKTAAVNKVGNEAQSDTKNKLKPDKSQEKALDISVKNRKRKLSETREMKQVDKKTCATDPQILLSNIDLNKFLTTVHGPE